MTPRDAQPRACGVCHASYTPTRAWHDVCSATCRQRRRRGTYVISPEDRAAMDRAAVLVPVPVPELTPDVLRAHLLAAAAAARESS